MKKEHLVIFIISCIYFAFSTHTFSQDENVGFIKRTWRKMLKSDKGQIEKRIGTEAMDDRTQMYKDLRPVEPEETTAVEAQEVEEEAVVEPEKVEEVIGEETTEVETEEEGAAEEEAVTREPTAKDGVSVFVSEDITNEEMIYSILDNLELWGEEILGRIPQLIGKTDEEGKDMYSYTIPSGEEVALGDLDRETLLMLFRRVSREASILNADRINTQLEIIKQVRTLENTRKAVEGIKTPPRPPKSPAEWPPRPPSPPAHPSSRRR